MYERIWINIQAYVFVYVYNIELLGGSYLNMQAIIKHYLPNIALQQKRTIHLKKEW